VSVTDQVDLAEQIRTISQRLRPPRPTRVDLEDLSPERIADPM